MITIFTIPKPFRDHIGVIQSNAIQSWKKLGKSPEIILYGDEVGTVDFALKDGLKYVPDVAKSEFNTPLLNDVFKKTEAIASNDILCYANADIIFFDDLIDTVKMVASRKNNFLVTGRRWNLNVNSAIDFSRGWETEMRKKIATEGVLALQFAMDYFIFKKESIGELPPFAVGRPWWDTWMIYHARKIRLPVIDATGSITCVHQNHNYNHLKFADDINYSGPESVRHKKIFPVQEDLIQYSTHDANYVIRDGKLSPQYLRPLRRTANNMYLKMMRPLRKAKNTMA